MGLADLPYLNTQPARAVPKGKTRVELRAEAKPLTTINEQQFRAAVWKRDKDRCRSCGRKVLKTLSRVPERGEVNHIHGRIGDLRFEVRAALLMCLQCHERFTGKVNAHRLAIIPSRTFVIRQGTFTDATYPVRFKETV